MASEMAQPSSETATTAMGRFGIAGAAAVALFFAVSFFAVLVPAAPAGAQTEFFDEVALALENKGYFVEDGADGSSASFADLVDWAQDRTGQRWYFASFAEPVDQGFADDLRDAIVPQGNVLLFFYDSEDFVYAELASDQSEATEERALEKIDGDWQTVEEFMRDVVDDVAGTSGTASTGTGGSTSSGGSGFNAWWLGVPVVGVGGGLWWSNRRRKKQTEEQELENAEKIRAEVQTELDELANDVLVLASPVDLSDNAQAVQYYRDATEAYSEISDLLPDPAELENANLAELSDLGARIVHARWQMDAAEALMDGEPIPEKPKVEPPPAPPKPPTTEQRPRPQMPHRQPRPRRPYSRSRRSGGGGGVLLDILIAGSGALGRGTRYGGRYGRANTRGGFPGGFGSGRSGGGGMFGGGSTRRSQPSRRGGGVFGGGRSNGSSRSRRNSGSSSRSRSSSRSSGRSSRGRSSSTRRRSSRRRR